ncbi:MAG: acyl-CoA carboxylase subunit beta [Pigmentiphaga sp.]
MNDTINRLRAARRAALDEARTVAVQKQHTKGKLTARERIAALLDEGSFREVGRLVQPLDVEQYCPADAIIVGHGLIDGRSVIACASDFTVLGGSSGHTGSLKLRHMAQRALEEGVPFILLLEGGGKRIQEGLDSRLFAEGGSMFQSQVNLSGWVPTVAVILGPGFAAPSNLASMCDFVVMVRGKSTMGMAGPALVKAGIGEDIEAEALGGAAIQADRTGVASLAVDSEYEALSAVRTYLSYLPANADQPAPTKQCTDAIERDPVTCAELVPANPRRAYDVRAVLRMLADENTVFEIRPTYAKNIVIAFARLEGRPVGFVANQAQTLGGMLTSAACEKAAHFISVCDAFGLPLVFLIDMPGFSVGSRAEATGLARRSARLVFELGQATVPRASVVLRKGYGGGFMVMAGGRNFDPDLSVAWPTAEICAMNIEGAVNIAFGKELAAAADPDAERAARIAKVRERTDVLRAAEGFGIDDVIEPHETRALLVETFARAPARRKSRPQTGRRHAISPI